MTPSTLEKIKTQKIGGMPVVVLPLKSWHEIEDTLEKYAAMTSPRYLRSIQKAREDFKNGKVYELDAKTGKFRPLRRK